VDLIGDGEIGDVAATLGLKEVQDGGIEASLSPETAEEIEEAAAEEEVDAKQEAEKTEETTTTEIGGSQIDTTSIGGKYVKREPMKVGDEVKGRIVDAMAFDKFSLTTADATGFEMLPTLINDYITNAGGNISVLKNVASGESCLVRTEMKESGDSPAYYRGLVTGIEEGGQFCDVLLVDYGQLLRSYPATKIFDIPTVFASWPAQALVCSLFGVESAWLNDDEKTKSFVELIKGKDVTATVKLVKEAVMEVEILLNGEDVRKLVLGSGGDADVAEQIEDELADDKESDKAGGQDAE